MGSKAPTFIGDVKTFSFVRNRGLEVSMLCNAQGHPIPVTRYQIIALSLTISNHVICAFAVQHLRFTIIVVIYEDSQSDYSGFLAFEICWNLIYSCDDSLMPLDVIRTSRHKEAEVLE